MVSWSGLLFEEKLCKGSIFPVLLSGIITFGKMKGTRRETSTPAPIDYC
jgi:hypothetical protein